MRPRRCAREATDQPASIGVLASCGAVNLIGLLDVYRM
jgi:hypothetical protein